MRVVNFLAWGFIPTRSAQRSENREKNLQCYLVLDTNE
jgi:hypothetical protein